MMKTHYLFPKEAYEAIIDDELNEFNSMPEKEVVEQYLKVLQDRTKQLEAFVEKVATKSEADEWPEDMGAIFSVIGGEARELLLSLRDNPPATGETEG